jgi:putative SOS response-associated peptidase YedK
MRWGLVPFWAEDIKVGFANINAKAKGIEGKPAFREAFQRRRCLVPVDNFYEEEDRGREAALCDRVGRPGPYGAGGVVGELALVGRQMGSQLRRHHHHAERAVHGTGQPDAGVLKPEGWPAWLGAEPTDPPRLKALLAPCPAAEMTCWPVSAQVGNVRNNDRSLIEPIAGAE